MQIDAERGALCVLLGRTFGLKEAARLRETVGALGPCSRLTVDFSAVHESEDAALAMLAGIFQSLPRAAISIRGLTLRQSRILQYLRPQQTA